MLDTEEAESESYIVLEDEIEQANLNPSKSKAIKDGIGVSDFEQL